VVEQPVAAVLSARIGHQRVAQIVEALYAARAYTPDEMLEAFRQGGHNPYPARYGTAEIDDPSGNGRRLRAKWTGQIYCGHNPWLHARRASVWTGDDGGIEWKDDPAPGAS